MKLLLDVHIAASVSRALVAEGHDVLRAGDAHAHWSDARLLELAVHEVRVVLTEDRDFSDLIFRAGATPPPAVIYLCCEPAGQPDLTERLLLLLANAEIDGHMIVIQRANVRYRPLPRKDRQDG